MKGQHFPTAVVLSPLNPTSLRGAPPALGSWAVTLETALRILPPGKVLAKISRDG